MVVRTGDLGANVDSARQAWEFVTRSWTPGNRFTDEFANRARRHGPIHPRKFHLLVGRMALDVRAGNCGPQSSAALVFLQEHLGYPEGAIKYCTIDIPGGHAFLLVGDLPPAARRLVSPDQSQLQLSAADESWPDAFQGAVCAVCDPAGAGYYPADPDSLRKGILGVLESFQHGPLASRRSQTVPHSAGRSSVSSRPRNVLVTGFNDWEGLGASPDVWRCRNNASCRLLVGGARTGPARSFDGPLPVALRDATGQGPISWSFATLPTVWGVATERSLYAGLDVVVHIGLGSERQTEIFVEDGAYNFRRGIDAAGDAEESPVLSGRPNVIQASGSIAASLQAVDGRTFGGVRARVVRARPDNVFVCNETHAHALHAVSQGRIRRAYCLHIPRPRTADGRALASAVAGVVVALLDAG